MYFRYCPIVSELKVSSTLQFKNIANKPRNKRFSKFVCEINETAIEQTRNMSYCVSLKRNVSFYKYLNVKFHWDVCYESRVIQKCRENSRSSPLANAKIQFAYKNIKKFFSSQTEIFSSELILFLPFYWSWNIKIRWRNKNCIQQVLKSRYKAESSVFKIMIDLIKKKKKMWKMTIHTFQLTQLNVK